MIPLSKVKEASYMAIAAHGSQTYDGYPYYYHLEEVVKILHEFHFIDDKYKIAGYLHDILEDTALSYNDIKNKFGEEIAEIVYCVTDELGRNRKERKTKTYPKISANKDAIIIKLADRIANVRNSLSKGHKMGGMYRKEYKDFKSNLYESNPLTNQMWLELDRLINEFE